MSTRFIYFLSLLTICALLGMSLYLQFDQGFLPCPLCVLQRATFILLGFLFLLGILLAKKRWGRLYTGWSTLLITLFGMALAGRQLWLQYYPSSKISECGVSLEYMLQAFPMNEVVQKVFEGSAECAQKSWEFLSLSMAGWTFIWFIAFFIVSVYLLMRESR
jgi:disulfide bond formation protein DsbB